MAALQTGVFLDGRWVTRNVNIRDILQENERREAQERQHGARQHSEQPVLGLLSRTILRSPVINWIIPARVRHREKNDVVFIGEDFIHIREILPDGHLKHVATKADFGSHIRAARVFGEPRKFIHPPMVDEPQVSMEIDYTEVIPPQILVLTLQSQELLFLFAHQNPDGTIDFWSSAIPVNAHRSFLEQPGKHLAVDPRSRAVAVAASESTILVYSAKTMHDLRNNFSHDTDNWTPIKTELPIGVNGIILKMEFLYPEPNDENHVILLVIYTKDRKTRMTCYEWDHSLGLKSIRKVVEGFPLHKNQQLPLLLIPLQHGPSFMLVGEKEIYLHQEIMTGNPVRSAVALASDEGPRFPGSSRRLPVWTSWARTGRNWIWNKKPEENFYLVREDGVVHYMQVNTRSGALTSKAGHFDCNVNTAFASLDVGFYLDTPDVLVAAGDMAPGEIVKIGQWRDEISISERTASPSRRRTRAQVMEPDFITAIPNWAPTMDLTLADMSGSKSSITGARNRVLTTSGRYPYGAVTEIRVGLDAKLGFAFQSSELSGLTGLWTLPDASHDGVFFLLSFPSSTTLLHIFRDASDPQVDFDEDSSGIDFNNETILTTTIGQDIAIQITLHTVVVLDIISSAQALPRKAIWELPSEQVVLAAASCPQLSTVYLAVRTEDGLAIQPGLITDRDGDIKFGWATTTALHGEPTCLQVLSFQTVYALLVATADGLIRLYAIGKDGRLGPPIADHQIDRSSTHGSLAACQSAVLLHSVSSDPTQHKELALVCGLRNGDLYSVEVFCNRSSDDSMAEEKSFNNSKNANSSLERTTLAFGAPTRIKFGLTPTTVFKDGGDESSVAFATCGSDFCRLNYSNGHSIGIEINNVWFTDRNQPAFQQGPVSTACRIAREPHLARDVGNALVCISGNSFLVAQLSEEKQAVPRRLPLQGTPNRVVYSECLKALFVASRENSPYDGFRVARSFIRMIDDSPEAKSSESIAEYELEAGARVNSMIEWVLKGESGRKHAMIAVGTAESDGRTGKLVILQRRQDSQGVQLIQAKEINFKGPVYSLATYGEASLVVCSGNQVRIYRYQATSPRQDNPRNNPAKARLLALLAADNPFRFRLSCEHELPSPGIQITTAEPIIHVSTAKDSLMSFRLISTGAADDSESQTLKFETFFTDRQARQASCHLPLTLPSVTSYAADASSDREEQDASTATSDPSTRRTLVLVADKSASVTGLLQPTARTYQSAAPTIFEACLPRSVTRLRLSTRPSLRPPYRQKNVPGLVADDIVGSASDGTIFGFSIIEEHVWRLLRFLQGLCKVEDRRAMECRPGSGYRRGVVGIEEQMGADGDEMDVDGPAAAMSRSVMREVDPDRDIAGLKKKTVYHVEGDTLARFLDRGGEGKLLKMVAQADPVEAEEVKAKFRELTVQAFGLLDANKQTMAMDGVDGEADLKADVVRVLAWLRDVLEPVV